MVLNFRNYSQTSTEKEIKKTKELNLKKNCQRLERILKIHQKRKALQKYGMRERVQD